jgi:hypothetical protein
MAMMASSVVPFFSAMFSSAATNSENEILF